ncbi:hypothetical protein VNO80_18550 [Phaseolus coccineus]|uniref:Uncharacterized protein n=1 Tax=Phaseolus coccineus TaxID=3886 RepID=A0AAN9MFK3_PHACN
MARAAGCAGVSVAQRMIQFRFHHYYAMDSWDGEQKGRYSAVTSSPPSFVKRVVTFTGQPVCSSISTIHEIQDCELKGEMEEGEGRGTKGKEGGEDHGMGWDEMR